jgi:hypothetical protein
MLEHAFVDATSCALAGVLVSSHILHHLDINIAFNRQRATKVKRNRLADWYRINLNVAGSFGPRR